MTRPLPAISSFRRKTNRSSLRVPPSSSLKKRRSWLVSSTCKPRLECTRASTICKSSSRQIKARNSGSSKMVPAARLRLCYRTIINCQRESRPDGSPTESERMQAASRIAMTSRHSRMTHFISPLSALLSSVLGTDASLDCSANAGQAQDGVGVPRSVRLRGRFLNSFPIFYVTLEFQFREKTSATSSRGLVTGLRAGHSSVSSATLATARKALRSDGDHHRTRCGVAQFLVTVTGGVT